MSPANHFFTRLDFPAAAADKAAGSPQSHRESNAGPRVFDGVERHRRQTIAAGKLGAGAHSGADPVQMPELPYPLAGASAE